MEEKTGNASNVDLERLLDDIKVVVRDGQELLKTSLSGLGEQARSRAQTTDRIVRERPYQTVGIAFGLGLLVGVLVVGLCRRDLEEED